MLSMNLGLKSLEKLIKGPIKAKKGQKRPNMPAKAINMASGSEANITTSCEMEIFNFLWLIWDHYLPLAPT